MTDPLFHQPKDGDQPVFREPWEAQAFAMTLKLHESGLFTWAEWTEALSAEIAAAQRAGDPDLGDTYYTHWLAALEKLVTARGGLSGDEVAMRIEEWRRAYLNTPHGRPVELTAGEA